MCFINTHLINFYNRNSSYHIQAIFKEVVTELHEEWLHNAVIQLHYCNFFQKI